MKVLHVTFSDNYGGANIAAYRIHKSLENKIISKILVLDKKLKKEKNVIKIKNTNKLIFKLKNYAARIINSLFISKYNNSFNIFDSNLVDAINKSNFDIVHLHWINNEIMSIKDISRIKKKIVWTMHDMWPFCGSEHYSDSKRYVNGYNSKNKDLIGIDMPKYIWKLKKKYFSKGINIICPSKWMLKKVNNSYLFKNNNSYLLRYPINTSIYKRKKIFNKKKNLIKIIFCAVNFLKDKRKGFFKLVKSLNLLSKKFNFELNIIGEDKFDYKDIKFKINNLGYITDPELISKHFCENDLLFLPSESDNLPNVGIEALVVGLPVVCSRNNGFCEVVSNKFNGLVINDFNTFNLNYVLTFFKSNNFSRVKIANHAKKNFSYSVISLKLIAIYNKILNDKN